MARKGNVMRTLTAVLVIALAVVFTGTILSGKDVRADAVTACTHRFFAGIVDNLVELVRDFDFHIVSF